MGYPELIAALEKECEEKILKIRRDAEAEAEKIRGETAKRIEMMREECDRNLSAALRKQTGMVLSGAMAAARAARLAAERELSARLYRCAREALPSLRNGRYGEVFEGLVRELPPGEWEVVKVRPGDEGLAGKFFPEAEILKDGGIIGGFEVTAKNGAIRIINTFEKRLERAWADMLPEIMKGVYGSPGGE
jgi:V/A-type H+-transporting ATPase subunit E